MDDPVIIVGGGIGGLTAALALLRAGIDVTVYEATAEIGDVGAGITVGATASRGYYSLGLKEPLTKAGDSPGQSSAALHYKTGEVLGGAFRDRQWKPEDLGPVHAIHRADLFAILERAVTALKPDALRLDHQFERYEDDGAAVTVHFRNGKSATGRALIGCDGVRSAVRTQMFGPENPRFTGQVAYRFLVPMDAARPFLSPDRSGPFVGPGRTMTRYPIRHDSLVNCVAFVTTDAWTGESWSERCSVEELQDQFAGWHPDVLGLAAAAPVDGTAKWALYDRDPLPTWVVGRVALLGDAAHPMLPFLGLGAAMAIEDAIILGRSFAAHSDVHTALGVYQATRVERANLMLLESRRQMETFRAGPDEKTARTQTTYAQRMAYDPATAPLAACAGFGDRI